MRVAVTGSTGRLGQALLRALEDAPFTGPHGPIPWDRGAFDLDRPDGVGDALARDRPEVIIHAAAWTDVDGCARDPELAMRRNGAATGVLARACADRGVDLIAISTNEVFDGERTDRQGYGPHDLPGPRNAYGASKLRGEDEARQAYGDLGRTAGGTLGIARTAWLFGPPGMDFPRRILEVADRALIAGDPVRVVSDEWGTPTYASDVAEAVCELLADDAHGGIHHLVNGGLATRADWARATFAAMGHPAVVDDVPSSTWERASSPPRWGVLAPTPLPGAEPIRPWAQAMGDYLPALQRLRASAVGA